MSADRREDFAVDLAADLTEALSLGRSPEEALGGDPAAVAREWARESGLNATPQRYAPVVASVVLPLACAAFFGYFIVGGGPPLGLPYYTVAPAAMLAAFVTGYHIDAVALGVDMTAAGYR